MGYNPQESLENTNTMGTLLWVHPIVPWFMRLNELAKEVAEQHQPLPFWRDFIEFHIARRKHHLTPMLQNRLLAGFSTLTGMLRLMHSATTLPVRQYRMLALLTRLASRPFNPGIPSGWESLRSGLGLGPQRRRISRARLAVPHGGATCTPATSFLRNTSNNRVWPWDVVRSKRMVGALRGTFGGVGRSWFYDVFVGFYTCPPHETRENIAPKQSSFRFHLGLTVNTI